MANKFDTCKECNYVIGRTRIDNSVRDIFNNSNKCDLCKGNK